MGLCKKSMKDRINGNPTFGISGVKHGGEEAGKISLTLQTKHVSGRRRPLHRQQWPEEEEAYRSVQIGNYSMPTRFEPGTFKPGHSSRVRANHYGMCSTKEVTVERSVHPMFMVDVYDIVAIEAVEGMSNGRRRPLRKKTRAVAT